MKRRKFYPVILLILLSIPASCFSGEWTLQNNPCFDFGIGLHDIWGASGSDVFVVGENGTILHYDGSTWSAMGGMTKDIFSVWGSSRSDVFALSYGDTTFFHYNGSTWTTLTIGFPYSGLYSIWGSSGSDVFAVGTDSNILHYDGTAWSKMNDGIIELWSVWGSSGEDVFAVGGEATILHYNGSTWSAMINPLSGTAYWLSGVWCNSRSDVFAVGGYHDGIDYHGAILHYNGETWSLMTNPLSGTAYFLDGVWGSSGSDVFAVGGYCDSSDCHGVILHYNGIAWSVMTSEPTAILHSVWGSSGSDVFTVGGNGTILHYGETPTLIELSSFAATPSNREVTIKWSTSSEVDNAGFNIYRSGSENGEYIKINSSIISATCSATQGASYKLADTSVQNRKAYYYKLEDVDINGRSTFHGPVSAIPRLICGLMK